ncbi:hypothetical protein EV127DRAFT_441115 [Xylaria flabelliformis]|nr:hypothetical protein EV127DRAFT_441115 [Xylaria flabelliformis]
MKVRCQVIRPQDARQYRQRSVSVLTRSDITQDSSTIRHVDYPETSATRPPPEITLSPNTRERLTAAKLAQDEVKDHVRAQALVMREHQYEELRIIRQFRESTAREKREREELSHLQQVDDFERTILEFETRQAVEERTADLIRTEVRMAAFREYMTRRRVAAVRQSQLEQDRMLAEQMGLEAIIAATEIQAQIEAQIQAQEAAEEREQIRQERLRECAVCMVEDDMDDMIQTPCAHWYCSIDLHSKFSYISILC